MEFRTVHYVPGSQMNDWKAICKAFAEKIGATLLFVNGTGCGVEFKDGSFRHYYVDEMEAYLKNVDNA